MKSKRMRLSDDDYEQIVRAVEALPDIDHRIVSIMTDDRGGVFVHTGEQVAPRAGCGDVLEAKQSDDGEWSVKKVGGWIS